MELFDREGMDEWYYFCYVEYMKGLGKYKFVRIVLEVIVDYSIFVLIFIGVVFVRVCK